jgi:hypothetical protein
LAWVHQKYLPSPGQSLHCNRISKPQLVCFSSRSSSSQNLLIKSLGVVHCNNGMYPRCMTYTAVAQPQDPVDVSIPAKTIALLQSNKKQHLHLTPRYKISNIPHSNWEKQIGT